MAGNNPSIKVSVKDLVKIYDSQRGKVTALNGVNLEIRENTFTSIVGPSGCGKSTLLNILAGLDIPTSEEVLVDGAPISGPGPDRGVVFQQYALFPWLTVEKNIQMGLHCRKLSREKAAEVTDHYLDMMGLTDFRFSYPKELSGGMKQRVAVARAYAMNPSLLLMDEPFGALDAQTRAQLQSELLDIWEKEQKTCLFITHDVEEAVLLSQRVVIMSARPGRIKRIVDIDVPYPRTQKTKVDARFTELKNQIWEEVYLEYLEQRK